jgi:hypothetical protein
MVDEATASASKDVEEDLLAQTAKVRLLAGWPDELWDGIPPGYT